MVLHGPEEVSRVLVSLLRKGDIDAVEELYEPGAVFADHDGVAAGWPAIRRAHRTFVDGGSDLTLGQPLVIEVADLALVQWTWVVTRPDGTEMTGASAEVLRKQPDGAWRFVIDNSDGAALIGEL